MSDCDRGHHPSSKAMGFSAARPCSKSRSQRNPVTAAQAPADGEGIPRHGHFNLAS